MRTLSRRSYPWTGLDPERRNSIFLLGGIALVVLVALGLIAYGYYDSKIAPRQVTVLTVGERKFDYGFYERRAKAEFLSGTLDTSNLAQSVADVLSQIEREEVTRQAAAEKGITASEEEIDSAIKTQLSLPPETTRDQMSSVLRQQLVALHMPLDEYRDIARAQVLDTKLRDQFKAATPAQTDYVNMKLIRVLNQADADTAKKRLDNGEDFSTVAISMSRHASSTAGGELGWAPKGSFSPAINDFAFSQTGRSGIIQAPDAFYIVEVSGKEVRDVDDAGRAAVATFQLADLLRVSADALHSTYTVTGTQVRQIVASLASA